MSVGIVSPGLLMGTPASHAVGNWYQQFLPNLNGRTISDIFFLDSLTGWAVTPYRFQNDTAIVLKTTNRGDTWFIANNRIGQFVGHNKVKFLNSLSGFVCGASQTSGFKGLSKSTDGGFNWTSLNVPVSAQNYEDMSVLNEDTIWLVASEGFTGGVWRTTNGGINWDQQLSSVKPDKIYMYNARIGFITNSITGTPGIYKTTNSGYNWVAIVSGQWFKDIIFADSLSGWYSAASNISKTSNGGNNWVLQNVPSGPDLLNLGINKLSLLNKDTLWAAGNAVFYPNSQVRAILLRTTNGGTNWQYQIPDTAINNFLYYHLQFIDKNNGWAYTTLKGIHTTTGGDPIWITAIEQLNTETPISYKLNQNYPNPFNPVTTIRFEISKQSLTELKIFDITGKQIQVLLKEELLPGVFEVKFDASDLSSGVYFYKLTVTTAKEVYTETKKALLIK